MKRVFLIVLDSVGAGELPDAKDYNDEGSHTIYAISTSKYFNVPNLKKLGFLNIDGVREKFDASYVADSFEGSIARMAEKSKGKDTTTGHWEIAGVISSKPFPTYPNGFPDQIIKEFEKRTGRKVICNLPYSGTEVIKDYGKEHVETGALIVYTSADSVFQIAAHEEVVPIQELYRYCEIAREILQGEHGVGRVIARPFVGEYPNFTRTSNRHDYSLAPPKTMLDQLVEAGYEVLGVGKIYDIFAGKGITDTVRTQDNADGIEKLIERMDRDFEGVCFVNLVDFDMIYGHRNDVDGYAKALSYFDSQLPRIIEKLRDEDILIITADHGCDPITPSTDHSREYVPMVAYGKKIKKNNNLGTRETYSDVAATILEYFNVDKEVAGTSFLSEILEN
ncbi:phosphopentomutase [Herbinix hemicellulosilytica]|uniref:Phosphopentomutase n=1 Tax=Herbinix hemicellulosilytica TaxID=1564487 RepID=A0A0H5SJT7_HERHM|nr:phosphopentomutase [Herbinix hemicellulosilytica]RBP59192.1 phosphopentomutase [Herbinix hemicellulosilytica]CRZ35365.1 Phosphopentomutase [Herbinix hemicellulosilytica]